VLHKSGLPRNVEAKKASASLPASDRDVGYEAVGEFPPGSAVGL